jgi:ankyrin repeat protein
MSKVIVTICALVVMSLGFSSQPYAKDEELGFALGFSAANGDLEKCKAFLDEGAEVNAMWAGQTPLMVSSQRGHTEIVQLLLKKGADPNLQDPMRGKTALMLAVEATSPKPELVKALLDGGAKPDLKDKQGNTPLAVASKKDQKEIVRLLQDYKKK